MPSNTNPLVPDGTYHIYNRINGQGLLYRTDENYRYFLELYKKYISPLAETFCYCLMPNHFHFLIRIRSEPELEKHFMNAKKSAYSADLTGLRNLSGLISQQFGNFLNAYAKAFNKQENRKGSLFMRPYKRKRVTNEKYLQKIVHYIHYNPVEANLCSTLEDYRYSSYKIICNGSSQNLNWEEVLNCFGDLQNFIHCHQLPPEIYPFQT